MSPTSDSSSEENSSLYYKSDTWSHLEHGIASSTFYQIQLFKIMGKATLLEGSRLLYWIFFKDLAIHNKKTNRTMTFSFKSLPNILQCRDRKWDLPTMWQQDFFRHILKNSTGIYKYRPTVFQNHALDQRQPEPPKNIQNQSELPRKGKTIYLPPLYHFHPLHWHLDISRAITVESSALNIASS